MDIGCGNGQATTALGEYFDKVVGVDPSETQIKQATPHPNVTYEIGTMEEHLTKLADESVSCITSAQAAHWLDIPSFYGQVQRVLKPGGVVAIWTYGLNVFPKRPSVQAKVQHFYDDVLGEYWDDRRRLVENLYRDIPLIDTLYQNDFQSGERVSTGMDIEQEVTAKQFGGYLRSWSAYAKYCEVNVIDHGAANDPVVPIETELGKEDNTTLVIWPVTMLLSTKKLT